MSLPKHLAPYWSNPLKIFFYIQHFCQSAECQKNWQGGLDQFGPEHFEV